MANSRPKPSNEEIRALEGRLEDCILRWGKRKNMECENQFRVAGNTVTCKFKTSASTFCNKTYKLQQSKEGSSWQISNFTNHINAEHNKTKKVSTASPTTNQNQEESTAISTPNSGNEVSRKRKSTTSGITFTQQHPKEDDVNEFDECEELEDEGNDPLDRNVLDEYEQSLLNVISEGQLNDYSSLLEKCVLRNENSPRPHNDPENVIHNSAFVVVTRSNGSQVAFKKRTVVWMCENGVKKQSNDRSKRVTQGHNFLLAKKLIVRVVEKRKIRIGDWCLFACENNSKKKKSRVMVGHVLSLSLINASKKDSTKPIYDWKEGDKNVGVICDWFILDNKKQRISGLLIEQAMFSHGLHPCEYYVCSVPSPTFSVSQNKSEVRLSNETVVSLQESIKSYSV